MTPPLSSRLLNSFRVRSAAYIVVAAIAVFGVVTLLYGVLQNQARQQVETTLQREARALAVRVVRDGRPRANDTLQLASNLLGDTRIVANIDGTDQYWNRPRGTVYARGSATRDWVTVTLERVDPISTVRRSTVGWVITLGVGVVGAIAWLFSGSLTARLRRSLRGLSGTAERLSEGDLSVRAPETADEAGVVARAFNRMAARLEAADAQQRAFLADAAHELRTPVTAIEGFATALADGTAHTPEDRAEAIETIREESVRLRALVADLQQFTWSDLEPPVHRAKVDLAATVRAVVTRYQPAADERGVVLVGPPPNEHVAADTDAGHVETVVANLISNAIAATPPKGQVRVSLTCHGRDVVLSVADTGKGIDAAHLPYIFDRLFRVDGSRARDELSGSGLGLAIAKRLVLLLDGRIDVESTPGIGTIFTVRLRGVRTGQTGRGLVMRG